MKVCSGDLSREELCALLVRAAVDICALQSRVAELEAARPHPASFNLEEARTTRRLVKRMTRITYHGPTGQYVRPMLPRHRLAS